MKRLALLPFLVFALACSDNGIVQPDAAAPPDVAAAAVPDGGTTLHLVMELVGNVEPGQMRTTPGGVLHWKGFINALSLTGEAEGMWYAGFRVVSVREDVGRGPTVTSSVLVELNSMLGQPVTGGFECHGGNGLMDGYPGPAVTHSFHVSSCIGWGDFDGQHMKVTGANRIGAWVYDALAVIW